MNIKSMTLEIGGKEVTVTREEWAELYELLKTVFGEQPVPTPMFIPVSPPQPYVPTTPAPIPWTPNLPTWTSGHSVSGLSLPIGENEV